jgi:hypothetical protein
MRLSTLLIQDMLPVKAFFFCLRSSSTEDCREAPNTGCLQWDDWHTKTLSCSLCRYTRIVYIRLTCRGIHGALAVVVEAHLITCNIFHRQSFKYYFMYYPARATTRSRVPLLRTSSPSSCVWILSFSPNQTADLCSETSCLRMKLTVPYPPATWQTASTASHVIWYLILGGRVSRLATDLRPRNYNLRETTDLR